MYVCMYGGDGRPERMKAKSRRRIVVSLVCSLGRGGEGLRLALGLNKYSHNACAVVVDIDKEAVIFAQEKERLSRVKNDGGAIGDLVLHALRSCGAEVSDIVSIASNNHHSPIAEMESAYIEAARLGLAGGTELWPEIDDVLDPLNLLTDCPQRIEVTHQLAHALGSVVAAPKSSKHGIAIVFDGMGESARRFRECRDIVSDASLKHWDRCEHVLGDCALSSFDQVPDSAREAESVYFITKDQELQPLWKRWCQSRPGQPLGYRDWFLSPSDSLGAAYSFVSHVIFADWNACGKVMGLAPWGAYCTFAAEAEDESKSWGAASRQSWGTLLKKKTDQEFLKSLLSNERIFECDPASFRKTGCRIDREAVFRILNITAKQLGTTVDANNLVGLWTLGDDALRACCAVLAYVVQSQLEEIALPWLHSFAHDAELVTFSGGVALNSVLIGKAEAVLNDTQVFVPCAPGDEGIALGCAAIAARMANCHQSTIDTSILPFSGGLCLSSDISLLESEWLTPVDTNIAEALANDSAIVFWYQDRSEFGPRALGHRSILASPRDPGVVDYINSVVKGREDFRPLAPVVLAKCAADIFDIGGHERSPYMSKVWPVKPEMHVMIPACVHVDGTARPQTVEDTDAELDKYRALLEASQPPVLLDTSFNTKRAEPIVETPLGAVSTFLAAAARRPLDTMDQDREWLLALGDYGLFRPADCPINLHSGHFELETISRPWRRHSRYELTQLEDGSYRLRVLDLDEILEDPIRTGRGDFFFKDALEAELYVACDGHTIAAELARAFSDDEDNSAHIYLRLARLWRATLIGLK